MPVRVVVLLAILAVSIASAPAEEYGYYAEDEFDVTDHGTDSYRSTDSFRSTDSYRNSDSYRDVADDGYDDEAGFAQEYNERHNRDTHRFEDYVHVEYVEGSRARRPRPERVTHYTPSELTAPEELTERVFSEYEELPLEVYEEFGGCDNCVGGELCNDCQAACGSCGPCCGGLSAGAEMTILNFHPDGNRESGFGGVDTDYNYEVSPRVWIGYEGSDGWGLRGRYWNFDAEASDSFFLEQDDTFVLFSANQQLDVYMVDFEFTKRFCFGRTAMRTAIGGRNGAIRRHGKFMFGTVDNDGDNEDATIGLSSQSQSFEGTGLTFALDANRPLFCSQLELVCNARGSVLWGENDFAFSIRGIEAEPDGAGNLNVDIEDQSFNGEENTAMWIGELQAGLQWTQPYQCFGGGVMFVRSVFEAQWWSYPSLDAGEIGTIPSEDLAFYGLAFSAGFSH